MPSGGGGLKRQRPAMDRTAWRDEEELLLIFGALILSGGIQ